jgi:cytochrome c peroxidase
MTRKTYSLFTTRVVVVFVLLSALVACTSTKQSQAVPDAAKLRLFAPLPQVIPATDNALTPEKVELGRMLYYEPRLSKSQTISCNNCHQLADFGVDGQPTSTGHKGAHGDRNSPTVYNAAGHFVQFWDGRARDVEAQAKGPMMNPVEMAMPSDKAVVAVLKSIPDYVQAFKRAFPSDKDPVTLDNAAQAIGAFERGLVTPARWDKFLQGGQSALSAEEKVGFNTFTEAGCQTCHVGTYVGGNLYQKLGAVQPWPDTSDPGRFNVTKSEADRMVFKVPSLRNVEKTGPYFHNGKVATLEQAISAMGEYELGKKLSASEVASIAAWLKSLTGELPADYIKPPVLPQSTAKTPKPDMT